MSETGSPLQILSDARLAPYATANVPTWLWSPDGSRILLANPAGAAIFDFKTPSACATRTFAQDQLAASQIARLAGTLVLGSAPRLEMLRGFGAGFGRALLCQCSRIMLADRTAILVVSTRPAGPNFSLAERVRRLLSGVGEAVAAYSPDFHLIDATESAKALLAERNSLDAIDAKRLGAAARDTGHAHGASKAGTVSLDRIGTGANTILLARFEEAPAAAPAEIEERSVVAPVTKEHRAAHRPEDAPAVSEPSAPKCDSSEPDVSARRHPLRFVWQMDAQNRFTLSPGEFTDLLGPGIATTLNKPWEEIVAALGLDPLNDVVRAIASRDTWSGIPIKWPIEGSSERIDVELSGLPIYDRDRVFRGYRGFGVCRDVERVDAVLKHRAGEQPVSIPHSDEHVAEKEITETPEPSAVTVEAAENVLPFRGMTDNVNGVLSAGERNAFSELARQLSARLHSADQHLRSGEPAEEQDEPMPDEVEHPTSETLAPQSVPATHDDVRPLLNGLPVGVLIHRHGQFLYANKAFLDWTGHDTLTSFDEAGGLDSLFLEGGKHDGDSQSLTIETPHGDHKPTQARLFTIPWDGTTAMALVLTPAAPEPVVKNDDAANELRELRAILDTATDGILVLDGDGRVLSANHGAQALFGYEADAFSKLSFADLFAPASQATALGYLHRLASDALSRVMNEGRDVTGRTRRGEFVPLFMTLGRISENGGKFCAVLRDVTQWKKTEEDLIVAKKDAERSSSAKSEFLAKVSHEIRTPLNAIIGFSEVMMNERFGPVGNERYRDYLKDIHTSGGHLVSLLNDLLDLSKIEAGKLDLTFADLNLNDLTQQSVAIMQPEANRERIIIRTSLPTALPQVKADARSVRQIILNLLSNSIKFTGAGGQVIVSTAVNDNGDVVLRVRDTGTGMSENEIAVALEPFRQFATSARTNMPGTGLGLPLTKALAEANRARFSIRRAEHSGTLVEIAFPKVRIPAE